jgi:nucleotide-binding universal stress UspA family protein
LTVHRDVDRMELRMTPEHATREPDQHGGRSVALQETVELRLRLLAGTKPLSRARVMPQLDGTVASAARSTATESTRPIGPPATSTKGSPRHRGDTWVIPSRLALKVRLAVEEGDPVQVLAGVARERGVAVLVTGTRGRNTLRSAPRGSVTVGLVRAGRPVASCP